MSFNDDIRFGTTVKDKANSEVTTYYLSDEELLKYRHGKQITQLEKAKRLLKDTFMYPHEISEATGVPSEEVYKEYWKLRKQPRKGWH